MHRRFHVILAVTMIFSLGVRATGRAAQEQGNVATPTPQSAIEDQTHVASSPSKPQPKQLSDLRRIYVDSLGEDPVAKQVQSMLIAALVETGRFVVTENRESADAILKGVASETSSKDYHASSDSSSAGAGGGSFSALAVGSVATANGSGGHAATSRSDSSAYTETTYIARLSIRL